MYCVPCTNNDMSFDHKDIITEISINIFTTVVSFHYSSFIIMITS